MEIEADTVIKSAFLALTLAIFLIIVNLPKKYLSKLRSNNRASIQTNRHFLQGAHLLSRARSTKNKSAASALAKDALSEADKAILIQPRNGAAHILRGLAQEFLGHRLAALRSLTVALTPPAVKTLSAAEKGDALVKRAEIQMGVNMRRRVDSALEDLVEAVEICRDNPKAFSLLGECYEYKGLKDEADKAFSKVSTSGGKQEMNEKTGGFVVGQVPTVIYIPDFIDEAEETQLSNQIYQAPVSKWKTLKNRRLQNWGGVVHEKGLISQDLPLWLTKLNQRIYQESGIFPAAPNHVLINEYLHDQGIMPHQDGPAYFPAAAILSLGSPVVMNFTPHLKLSEHDGSAETANAGGPQNFSLLLMPRSLLIFKDLAYSDYLHGIEDSAVQCYDGAVNVSEAKEAASSMESTKHAAGSENEKVLHRVNTRISLTCRLVLKVRKNLIKI